MAVYSALKVCGRIIRVDVNTIQVTQINLNSPELANTCSEGVATADCVERDIVIIGVLNLLGIRITLGIEIKCLQFSAHHFRIQDAPEAGPEV